MRSVLPAIVLAALAAGPAAAEPFITPGVIAGTIVPTLLSAAIEANASRGYVPGPYVHSASGTYVQFYDPRTGVPVGGPVPVSPEEFAARAASIPPGAPAIRVRAAPTVTDEGIEPVRRGYVRPRVYGPRPYAYGPRYEGYGPRYGVGVYAPGVRYGGVYGPRYGARVYAPGVRYGYGARYGARAYAPGPRYGAPIYAGPRRFAPAAFRGGRHVPGYSVVPRHRVGAVHPGRGPMHHGRRY